MADNNDFRRFKAFRESCKSITDLSKKFIEIIKAFDLEGIPDDERRVIVSDLEFENMYDILKPVCRFAHISNVNKFMGLEIIKESEAMKIGYCIERHSGGDILTHKMLDIANEINASLMIKPVYAVKI